MVPALPALIDSSESVAAHDGPNPLWNPVRAIVHGATHWLEGTKLVTILARGVTAAVSLLSTIHAVNAADPTGTWLTEGGKSRVRISDCGGALCGSIAWLREPNANGRPKLDENNPDPGSRTRPLVGTRIVLEMKPSGGDKWQGRVYNPEDGKTYTGYITMQGANALKLEGCALGGLVCKGQNWTRAN